MRQLWLRVQCLALGHILRWHPPLLRGYGECMRCRETFRLPEGRQS
jgi:hypothetical protein